MINRVIIYPYRMQSKSAAALCTHIKAQGVPCLKVYEDGNYRPRETDLIINWGNPRWPYWAFYDRSSGETDTILNFPKYVAIASNKLAAFRKLALARISVPPCTTDSSVAMTWVSGGSRVLGRRLLNSSGGKGIVEFSLAGNPALLPEDFENIPLFVKYIPKIAEYRVHVFNGIVVDTQRKRKSREALANEEVNQRIRNHDNGWVFTRENCTIDDNIVGCAIGAVSALGLDFGAVDIIVSRNGTVYVLEVNTAPGLENTTVTNYTNAILSLFGGS